MTFLKNLGSKLKKGAEKVAFEIRKQQEIRERENSRYDGYIKLKKQLLRKLTLTEFKKICKDYGIGKPELTEENPFNGEITKIDDTERNLYGHHILENMKLDKIIEICKRKKISVVKEIKEKEEIDREYNQEPEYLKESKKEESDEETQVKIVTEKISSLDKIVNKIENEFEFDKVKSEEELEMILHMFLKCEFKDKKIERQFKIDRGKIDLCVDSKYGIELKIAESNKILENLEGQVRKYIKYFGKNKVSVILLKTPKIDENLLYEYVEEYENKGAKVLVLDRGTIKRRKTKTKTFKLMN